MTAVIQVQQVYYPESDGKPMGETDDHRQEMVRQIEVLEDFFQGQNVYVSGNLLVYYVQGDPRRYVVPDALALGFRFPRWRWQAVPGTQTEAKRKRDFSPQRRWRPSQTAC